MVVGEAIDINFSCRCQTREPARRFVVTCVKNPAIFRESGGPSSVEANQARLELNSLRSFVLASKAKAALSALLTLIE